MKPVVLMLQEQVAVWKSRAAAFGPESIRARHLYVLFAQQLASEF